MDPPSTPRDQNLAAPSNTHVSPFVSSLIESLSTRKKIEDSNFELCHRRYWSERNRLIELEDAMSDEKYSKFVLEKGISVLGEVDHEQRLVEAQERVRKAVEAIDIGYTENQGLEAKLAKLEYRLSRYVVDLVLEWKRSKKED